MKKQKRQQWLVDHEVQSAILIRMITYWALAMLLLSLPRAAMDVILNPAQSFGAHYQAVWRDHWLMLLTLTVFLPFVLHDMLKFSNRFAGPIFRLRRELDHYMNDGEIKQFKIRDNDYWKDLIQGFNHLAARVQCLEEELESEEYQVDAPKEIHFTPDDQQR